MNGLQALFVILLKELLNILLLLLLIHQPLIPFFQKVFKMLCFFLTINSITHPIRYLWWKAVPNERLLSLIGNLIFYNIV